MLSNPRLPITISCQLEPQSSNKYNCLCVLELRNMDVSMSIWKFLIETGLISIWGVGLKLSCECNGTPIGCSPINHYGSPCRQKGARVIGCFINSDPSNPNGRATMKTRWASQNEKGKASTLSFGLPPQKLSLHN